MCTVEDLRAIRPGWHDNEGQSIVPHLIDMCTELLECLEANSMEMPRLYPVKDGSIDIIWESRGIYCTLEAEDPVLTVVQRPPGRCSFNDIKITDFNLPENETNEFVFHTISKILESK